MFTDLFRFVTKLLREVGRRNTKFYVGQSVRHVPRIMTWEFCYIIPKKMYLDMVYTTILPQRILCYMVRLGRVVFVQSCIQSKKVKVKVTLIQALRFCTGRTAHRGSRGIALLFHDHGTRRG